MDVKSGILKGVEISEAKAKEVEEVATVEQAINVIKSVHAHTSTEDTLAALAGAETKAADQTTMETFDKDEKHSAGGVLDGVQIDVAKIAAMDQVADTIADLESNINDKESGNRKDLSELGKTLGSVMGVE